MDDETITEEIQKYWALRFTPYDDEVDLNRVSEFMRTIADYWVAGYETEENNHYHCVYQGEQLKVTDLRTFFQNDEIKGNKYFSCPEVRELDNAVMYAVKGGDYVCSDIWAPYVSDMYELSYDKPKSYEAQLKRLYSDYLDDKISDNELWIKIIEARCYFDLSVNFKKIDELVLTQILKKNPEIIRIVAKDRKFFSC